MCQTDLKTSAGRRFAINTEAIGMVRVMGNVKEKSRSITV